MDCEACAAPLEENLRKVPGVLSVRVDFKDSSAIVALGTPEPNDADLIRAVNDSGFTAMIRRKEKL